MKACALCGRLYPDDAGFCPIDGSQLTSATHAPLAGAGEDARIGNVMCGRYQIRRVVADGGMGRVYEALDMIERRNVALKILHPDVAQDEVSVERFKREFDVSKQLPHAHIVDVLDFQPTEDGSYALVMEFLYGEELRATLKREGVISPERVVRMLSQIALALDEAHARKLVHRDLKPDNVFLCQTREGDNVKILDFGSVKDKGDQAKKLTVMGTTIGSPYYMAPEQAQGLETLDQRADVWALAAIAYECVSGKVPFTGNNGPSILLAILTKEPLPVSNLAKGQKFPVPPTLDRVMLHAFKKNAATRIPSVGALADAVGAAYGLTGDHRQWAVTEQGELGQRIHATLPQMMQDQGSTTRRDAADAFFGESESLGAMGDPFGAGAPGMAPALNPGGAPAYAPPANPGYPVATAPVASAAPFANVEYSDAPIGVPKTAPSWLVPVIIGGVALVVGIIIALILLGCSKETKPSAEEPKPAAASEAPSAAAQAQPSAGAAEEPAQAGQSKYSEANFELSIEPALPVKAGQPSQANIVLSAKGPFHVNQKYPYKFKIKQSDGLKVEKPIVGADGVKLEEKRATMNVSFVPEGAGKKKLGGLFSFSVCTDDKCLIEKRELLTEISAE